MSRPFHVCIVGGGLVGISFALALRQQLDADLLRISLLEAWPLSAPAGGQPRSGADLDARSTALAWGTREIFQRLGVWPGLAAAACAIESIHISEQGRMGVTRLRAAESGVPALGYVVENAELGRQLLSALHAAPGIDVLAPVEVLSTTQRGATRVVVAREQNSAAQHELEADLAVICDGGRSQLCAQAGIHSRERDYEQHAVVFNVRGEADHQGMAYERFTRTGPMALLPLSGRRRAVICTVASADAARLEQGEDSQVIALLRERFGNRLGGVAEVGQRASFPLILRTIEEQARPGLVVLGNAAHTLHPVAGQGFNLSMRDVEALAQVVHGQVRAGASPGELKALVAYQDQRGADQGGMIGFTHGLNRLFNRRLEALGPLRSSALVSLDLLSPARRLLAEHAMGLA